MFSELAKFASTIRTSIGRGRRFSRRTSVAHDLGPVEFRRALEREKAIALRSGRKIVVLLMTRSGPDRHDGRVREVIHGEVRASDVVGWFDLTRLAVILPDTDRAGAQIVADRICATLAQDFIESRFDVFVFPDPTESQLPNPPHSNGSARRSSDSKHGNGREGRGAHVGTGHGTNGHGTNGHGSNGGPTSCMPSDCRSSSRSPHSPKSNTSSREGQHGSAEPNDLADPVPSRLATHLCCDVDLGGRPVSPCAGCAREATSSSSLVYLWVGCAARSTSSSRRAS
jgi:hypothetical protein